MTNRFFTFTFLILFLMTGGAWASSPHWEQFKMDPPGERTSPRAGGPTAGTPAEDQYGRGYTGYQSREYSSFSSGGSRAFTPYQTRQQAPTEYGQGGLLVLQDPWGQREPDPHSGPTQGQDSYFSFDFVNLDEERDPPEEIGTGRQYQECMPHFQGGDAVVDLGDSDSEEARGCCAGYSEMPGEQRYNNYMAWKAGREAQGYGSSLEEFEAWEEQQYTQWLRDNPSENTCLRRFCDYTNTCKGCFLVIALPVTVIGGTLITLGVLGIL